jgi:threonine dehydratase
MPTISAPPKIAATKGYGAKVIFSGSTSVEREAVCAKVIEETGARLVPPYDHPDIILGQGTMGLELQEQVERMMAADERLCSGAVKTKDGVSIDVAPEVDSRNGDFNDHNTDAQLQTRRKGLDAIIAPCGGGGMLSGVALSAEGTGIKVFGSEPSFEGADDARRGYYSGERVDSVSSLTIADGLRTPVGEYPWDIIYKRKLVSGMYAVGEMEILRAMRLVLERMKVVIEPSAAVPLAATLFNEDFRSMVEREGGPEGWDLGVVFSGGNVALEALGKLFAPE